MKFLLDTANVNEIESFCQSQAVAGVTTNPSLVAKEGKKDYYDLLREIRALTKGKHLSVEVTSLDPKEMIEQARAIDAQVGAGLTIKIPVMVESLPVITDLLDRGIRVNATACMTALQARMARDAGACYVSFFYNRMIDYNAAQMGEIEYVARKDALSEIGLYHRWRAVGDTCQVICGSIRKTDDITECFERGADYVTASPAILRSIIEHPKTIESITNFQKDIEAWLG